jgi:hypothetical protein
MADETTPNPDAAKPAPGHSPVGPFAISLAALYLVAIVWLALYSIVKLWPHPTPSGQLPEPEAAVTATAITPPPTTTDTSGTAATTDTSATTATDTVAPPATDTAAPAPSPVRRPQLRLDEIPPPTDKMIALRQNRLCAEKDAQCRECVVREMQLQYESQRNNDPQCIYLFWHHRLIWQEERLLLLVILAGAIGGLLHAIRSLVSYVGNRKFVLSWLPFYYLAPFSGATLAFVSYIVIRGGFFSSTSTTKDANPFMFVALGALSGLFSQQVLEKLKKVAESAFDKPPATDNPLEEPAAPVIDKLDPDPVPVASTDPIKVTGLRFVSGAAVIAGGKSATTTFTSAQELSFTLPTDVAAQAGTIDVIVENPAGKGGKSAVKKLVIGP